VVEEPLTRGGACCTSNAASSFDSRELFLVPFFDALVGGSSRGASFAAFRREEDFFVVVVVVVVAEIKSTCSSLPIDSLAARSLAATAAAEGLPLDDFLTGRATGSSVFAFFDFRTN
jgi:hypothetical protein